MEDVNGDVIQWKKLWQLISGIHYETPHSVVKEKLLEVSKELQDGISQYKKNDKSSDVKLQKIMKEKNQQKLQSFAQKLQQFLDIDALQSWNILCFYLVNEYRGSANSLSDYISTESSMLKLLNDIWGYYSLERMVMLKIVKNILEYCTTNNHPYSVEYKAVLDKIGLPNLRKSYIQQFEQLLKETVPIKLMPGDMLNNQSKMVAWSERKLRETNEILHILLFIIQYDGIKAPELKQLVELFKMHSFGRQQQYLDSNNDVHNDLVKKITYSEISIILKCLDLSGGPEDVAWIREVIKCLDGQIVSLHQYQEHGPLLLSWMLFNFHLQNIGEEEDCTTKYRQFGSRAVQLGVFEYLNTLISHPMFKDHSLLSRIVRKSIYNHLSYLCQLFDSDGSVGQHAKIYDLLSEILTTPSIASEFCKNEDDPIRSLFDTAMELFPIDFVPLSMIAYSLASAGPQQNKYIHNLLENLPVYTEVYNSDKYLKDEFVLEQDYVPFKKIDFTIPRGTSAVVIDKKYQTFVHFRVKFNYFNALHHEINELLNDTLRYTEINEERIRRITYGLKYLVVAVKRIQNAKTIGSEMVHPTEMVFDILIKFKMMQNPPIELLSQCLNVCAALVPLFEQEIYSRVINLNILPSLNNGNLNFKDYSNGTSFESSLVGYYLVNFEKNTGKYNFLLAYFNFLKTYMKLSKNNIYGIELPALIFLLREVFPHAHTWRFDSETERQKIYIFILQYFFDILQLPQEQLKTDVARNMLRSTCVYSLLNLDNGMTLLRFVGIGNPFLQSVMENEVNWMQSSNQNLNLLVQLSMTILMQILRLKHNVIEDNKILSPLESAIYTQPKQRDALRIIPVVTSYMNNIFNRRLPILSCRLLRRFAIEFQMSLLACLDMESDQIRLIFLQRLRDDLESDNLKIAVLEFVEACIQKQPGLTEAFFKVSYENTAHKLFLGGKTTKTKKNISDGILTYMAEYLEAISTDPKKLASPLLSRIMSLFHALWKNNMQLLIKELLEKSSFWSSLCNPLFANINENVRAYSQLFNILGIELYKINSDSKIDDDIRKVYEKFLDFEVFSKWIQNVFDLPKIMGENNEENSSLVAITDETPEWLSRLQSFKDLMVLILRKKNSHISIPDKSKKHLADRCLSVLVERAEYSEDFRPFVILAELYLIILSDYDHKYTENTEEDKQMLRKLEALINSLSICYKEIHSRAKESILAIVIKTIDLQSDELMENESIASNITRSIVEIICHEINDLEITTKAEMRAPSKSESSNQMSRAHVPMLLSVNLLKKIILISEDKNYSHWDCWFIRNKIFNRLLSVLSIILPIYSKRKITAEMLELLVILGKSSCSKEILYCDIGDYLWLKLLPPKELLQRPYVLANETDHKWHSQDWWPIYSRGIELVRVLLNVHKHTFFKEAIFFAGIHEEFLMDSLLLAKQSLEVNAVTLIKTTLEFVCEVVNYEKEWRMEHGQSLVNLMRCVQVLMDHGVSLLYRPKILKRLTEGPNVALAEHSDPAADETSDELVAVMNNLIEIVTLCSKCLLKFSPKLLNLICDAEFSPSQWFPLIEIQFGAPKINSDAYPQLSFGTVLSAVCIFTKVLNLQHHSFHEVALNRLPNEPDESDVCETVPQMTESAIGRLHGTSITASSSGATTRQSSPRTPFSKSLSMTSVNSFASSSAIALSNDLLTHLDGKLCVSGLEFVLTLLASQSLLALKDVNLSQREKQLIRRELSTELLIFHDFVKKRILKDGKGILNRKKHGLVPIDSDFDDEEDEDNDKTSESGSKRTQIKSTHHTRSMRVSVVRKLHLQQKSPVPQKQSALESMRTFSPITSVPTMESTPKKGSIISSTPAAATKNEEEVTPLRGILQKPTQNTSLKRVMFDDDNIPKKPFVTKPEEEPIYYEPEDTKYTGLSHVKIVEEDYMHFLSNIFSIICHSEN